MTKNRKRSYKKLSKDKDRDRDRDRDREKWIFGGIASYNSIKRGGNRKTYKRYKKRDSKKKYYRE